MSDVSAPSRSSSTQASRPAARPQARTAPATEDVRAMGEAFARARMQQPQQQAQGLGQRGPTGKGALLTKQGGERAPDAAALNAWRGLDERNALDRREGERHGDQGFGGMAQQMGVPVMVTAQAPAPQVDPSGFAQMLADLWTRENGRGAKEVRVRFGNATWPATGARLVQSADGLLDIAIEVAPGAELPPLGGLEQALAERGLAVASTTVTPA